MFEHPLTPPSNTSGRIFPDDFDVDSEVGLPPPLVVLPEQVIRRQQKMNGRVALPVHLHRNQR